MLLKTVVNEEKDCEEGPGRVYKNRLPIVCRTFSDARLSQL